MMEFIFIFFLWKSRLIHIRGRVLLHFFLLWFMILAVPLGHIFSIINLMLFMYSLFLKMINAQFNTRVKTLCSDNGGEFISSHFQSLLHSQGIINQRSYPHTPQQNKVVECKCRHFLEIARSLMFQASLSSPFRGHAILMATSIINRLPSSFSDYSLFWVFDCLCYATNTSPHKDRFAPRAIKCIFLGQKLIDFLICLLIIFLFLEMSFFIRQTFHSSPYVFSSSFFTPAHTYFG